jgi:hypothetical protein
VPARRSGRAGGVAVAAKRFAQKPIAKGDTVYHPERQVDRIVAHPFRVEIVKGDVLHVSRLNAEGERSYREIGTRYVYPSLRSAMIAGHEAEQKADRQRASELRAQLADVLGVLRARQERIAALKATLVSPPAVSPRRTRKKNPT